MSGVLKVKHYHRDTPLGVRITIGGPLLSASKDGCILRGTVSTIAQEYGISKATIYRIRKKAIKSLENGSFDVSSQRKKQKPERNPWP